MGQSWCPTRGAVGPRSDQGRPKDPKASRTREHTLAHTRTHTPPSGAHSDVPRDSHSIYKLNYSPWFAYTDHLCARAAEKIFPQMAKCSQWLPLCREGYYTLLICFLVSLYFLNILQ